MTPRPIRAPGHHGGDAAAIAQALGIERHELVDLSMSMNPFAPDVEAVLSTRLGSISDYPDPSGATACLAHSIGVDVSRIVLTNGGAEAIALVAGLQPVGSLREPEFSLYRRHLGEVDVAAPRWRSNPSNPLGQLRTPDAVQPGEVWDEAFYPLATGDWTDRRLDDHEVWRLGSLTKLWSCPGLRIGYVIAPDDQAAASVRQRQPRWSVNALALSALPALLDATDLGVWSAALASSRGDFTRSLRSLGFSVNETEANWVLVDDRATLRTELARHHVVVRDCTSFGLDSVFRVAIPRDSELDQVVGAFESVAEAR
ncbi:MAG: aminotransferase class I/II-fold pyridoxal phosphate-dependent enzyme [Ilumatobacter sp.]